MSEITSLFKRISGSEFPHESKNEYDAKVRYKSVSVLTLTSNRVTDCNLSYVHGQRFEIMFT
jgi:hypothetical protein